ncbi:MAG: hypothetical protein J6K42_00150 [Clostridia bacterium]|nr:hypothetical protein [Clostridia bacterium]
MKRRKVLLTIIVIGIICFVAGSGSIMKNVFLLQKQAPAKAYNSSQELIGSYEEAVTETATDSNGNEIENLEMNVYFLDEQGNKKRGKYQTFTVNEKGTESPETATLYVDLGLSQNNVSIINGKIKLNYYNATIIPTLSEGGIIKKINSVDDIDLNEIVAGNSVHLSFLMKQNVYWDNGQTARYAYLNPNSLTNATIEGDYVDEGGNTRHFKKIIKWKIDWDANTEIENVNIDNKLAENGNLIHLEDDRIVALFEVTSKNKAGGAIPGVGEYKMSGFKINGIAPEITVSDVTVPYNSYTMEDVNYDSASDTLTWKSVRVGADEGTNGPIVNWGFHSYVTAVYPSSLYNNYLKNQTNTVTTQLSVASKNMAYVNPKIQHTETSLLAPGTSPELGTRYTGQANASLTLRFDTYNGEIYSYKTGISDQSKVNSELIYYGVNTSAGYKEDCNVNVNVGGGIVNGVKIDWKNNNPAEHSFMDNNENLYSHEDFKYYTGIIITEKAITTLGGNGWIKVYDDETNSLIGTYTAEGNYKYDEKHKKVRIETSEVVNPGEINLTNLVELDNVALKAKYPNLSTFETFTKLASSSNAYIKIKGNTSYSTPYSNYARADYDAGTLRLASTDPITADTYESTKIKYSETLMLADYLQSNSQSNITYYKNPKVLVEFPSTVKSNNTKYVRDSLNVTSGDQTMEATISSRCTENGKDYFIISITGETNNSIDISAEFEIVPQTTKIKSSTDIKDRQIRTFANTTYNGTKIIGNIKGAWWNATDGPDTYDWNGNGITSDGDYFYQNTEIIFTEPVGVRTVTSLQLEGSAEEVLCPDIMELDKNQDAGKTVTVNNYLYNYSEGTLKKLKLVGRIPFKGNKFIKSGDKMGSTFDTVMTSGINIPSELTGKVTVKYSTQEVSLLNNSSVSNVINNFNWTSTFTSDAKSYMIDFGNTDIDKGSTYNFTYTIKLPNTLNYGLASFTSDAIAFNTVENGQEVFAIPVESPKVGISIESLHTFNLNFIKVDKDDNTKKLTGAKYKLTRVDGELIKQGEDWLEYIDLGSDTQSTFSVTGLYPEVEYKLQEIQAPTNYKMQDIVFKILDNNGTVSIEVVSGELGTPRHISTKNNIMTYQIYIPEELKEADYNTEYYYQNIDGTYAQKSTRQAVTKQAKIGTSVEVTTDDMDPKDSSYILSNNNSSERRGTVKADGTTVLKVYFDLNTANYKVEYYYQNVDGSYAQKATRGPSTRNNKIGITVTVTDDDKNPKDSNYQLSSHNENERTATVKADGTTVLKVYFDLKIVNYKVEYYYQDVNGNYATKTTRPAVTRTDKIGATVIVTDDDKDPKNSDYQLSRHNVNERTAIVEANGSTTLKVYFDLKNVNYIVEYYYQMTDGSYVQKSLRGPSIRSDKIGKTVTVTNDDMDPKDSNYQLSNHNVNERTATVKADGTTTLKVYFDLKVVNYKVEYYYQDVNGNYATKTTRPAVTRTDKIGATVTVTDDDKNPKDSKYTLSGNNIDERTAVVKADGTTKIKVYFDLRDVNYKVEYYYQNMDGQYATKTTRPAVTRADKIGKVVKVTDEDKKPLYDEYELSKTHDTSEQSGTVKEDGTTVLKVYFDIKKVNYSIEYYFLNDNGIYPKNYVSKVTSGPVMVGTQILRNQVNTDPNRVENRPNGKYLLDDEDKITTERTDSSLVVTTDESKNVFKVYFTKGYTVTYRTDDPGTFETKSQSDIPYGTLTPLLINNKTSRPGYTFTGWLEENTQTPLLQDVTISGTPVTHDITYVAQWKANENTPYQVWFYYQESGSYPNEPFAKVARTATTDTTVNLTVPSKVNDLTVKVTDSKATNEDISRPKAGGNYIYDTNASNVITHNVDGDGSTVLKVYFKQIPVNYNFDAILKDTSDKTLTRNQFTITRAGTSSSESVLWNKKAISESIEINEKDLTIGNYTYKITENETPNEKYVNVLYGKYISVVVAISNDGKPSVSSWKVHNNDGTEVDSNDSVYSYVNVYMGKVDNVDTIIVKVINPVRFTFELEKIDSEGNSLENTGISIKSDIIDGQNAAHRTEIETESKNGLQITDSGVITGETNENGVIKYEETWVNANEYTYEITETSTSGNQYVNILDGYKVVVRVKVNSDGTLEIIKNGNRNYTIVATETGKTVTDDLYNYVKITVSSNSLKAIIDNTGHINVEVTNPVKFNINLIKKDSTGIDLAGTRFSVNKEGQTTPVFDNKEVTTGVEIEEGPVNAGTYTYYIRENSTKTSKYTNILDNKYIKLVLRVNGNGKVEILNQDGDEFKVFTENGNEVLDYDNVIKFIKVYPVVNNDIYTINVKVINPVKYDVDIKTLDTANNFLDKTNVTILKENEIIYGGDATTNVEVNELSVEAGIYNYYIKQNTVKDNKFINPLDGRFIKAEVEVAPDGTLTVNKVELYEGVIGYAKIITSSEILKYLSVTADNSGEISTLNISIKDPVRFTVELKKVDTEGNGVQDTGITIKSPIVDEQNAFHKNEIYTESKEGLEIADSGEISGQTNNSGTVKYEETWVDAKEYTFEITENEAAGNQYVNILDGYKVIVKVRVSADGTLTIVKNGNKNYTIVATEQGKTVTDNMYEYVSVNVENNSLNAVINQTGKLNVEITNPVRFNIDLIKKDTEGNDLSGSKFTVIRDEKTIFDNKDVTTDIEVKEDPINSGTYTYTITENNAPNERYTNILNNRKIKLNVKVNGNGHIDILNQDGSNFKVYENSGEEVRNEEDVLQFIKVWTEVAESGEQAGVSTINVKVVNPVNYKVDIATATTAYGEDKNIDEYFLDKTDVKVYRKIKDGINKDIYTGQPIKEAELTETPMKAGTYEYYFTQTSTKDNKFINPLEGKFVKVLVTVSKSGMLSVGAPELFEGTIGDQYVKRITNDETMKYIKVIADNSSDISTLKIVIIDPVRFTVEVKKLDTEDNPNEIESTEITINSSVVDEQNAVHSEEVKETSESKDGLEINEDGKVFGVTNSEGKVKYEETWVNSNESPELSNENKKFYTYEITEDKTAGNQYVNVLEGYKVIVRVHVAPDGVLTLVDENGNAYKSTEKNKFVIVNAQTGEKIATNDIAYNYVRISVENNSLNAIISKTGKLNVDITNPVRFNIDLIKKDTANNLLQGTKFSVTKEGSDTPLFDNAEVTDNIEVREDPINAGVYTYYIKENETNKDFGNRYVNVLEGKYIKIKVKVNGNGMIDILDDENEINNDYYEVYDEGKKQKLTDNNILKYIKVKSHDVDGDGVYTIDVQVINPVRYEIDIITLDTLGGFLDGTNVTLYKDESDERKELFKGNATDVNQINKVEKLEVPADAGTYTYYLKENYAKNERYVNIIDGRYIKIQLTVAPNGMLSVTQELYEGEIGQGTKVENGSVFNYYSVTEDNSKDVSRINITLINPVKFVMEVDKYDTAENPLTGTTFEIESPIIGTQKYEHNNEIISGIADGGITENGIVTGITDNAIEKSPDGSMQRARISYEETWVNANQSDNEYYTYIIKETKTSGAQYVNILEGYQIVLKVNVDAEGNLNLKETNGRNYEIVKVDANAEDITDEVYEYVKINVYNNKILATLNTEVINPVRYNIAVYETIYGAEEVPLRNIPVEIQSEFSGATTLVTNENGYTSMEEKAVWADTYKYKIFQLDEFRGVKVEDEFTNMLDGYYIDVDLNVHADGVIKTMSADGDETTVSYKLYKKQEDGSYQEINFNDTIVDDFVKVKVTTSQDNVCTLNVYIVTPEKYDFKLMKTDIDILKSKINFEEKYEDVSENMNDVEFSVVVKDENGELVLKDTTSGRDAKTEFETINTKDQKTSAIDGTDGLILFDNILIEKIGTYTFEITEVTPVVEGMIYKDKSESIIITADIVVEDGKYVLTNMQIPQAERYTISDNTKLTGTETQTVDVNVLNERIKGKYDLTLNKVSKLTGKPLDGAVYKVTVEQEGQDDKVLYISDEDVLSKNIIIPYVGDENQDITGTAVTAFNDIRIEIPETYTIKIEEIKAPDTYTKLDDIIELEITTGIEGEYDDAHYVLKEIKLKDGNHNLISETHSKPEDEKQQINVQIKNEFFDLALRQYVTNVNGTEIESRKPVVTVTKDFNEENVTTAKYEQLKDIQRAYAGQEVIYTIEVFNEGIIDGYAEKIVEHLPKGLEFVDDEFNQLNGWKYDKSNNQVITNILSKEVGEDNFIPAYNKEKQIISSKKIQLKLKVSDNVKLKTKLTTIAEITNSLAKDRKENLDRDSNDLVTMPESDKLAEYTENQEDDDDFEKLIIEEFDLAPVKYIKSVNGKDCDERFAKLKLDSERAGEYKNGVFNGFKYKSDEEMLKLKQNDIVVYGINVYNEGSVKAYAKEVKDTIPSGLVFIKDSEINKKYDWKMLDSEGNVTDDVTKAVCVVTDYLAKDIINELNVEDDRVNADSKTVEVEFKITEPNTQDRIIENKAEVSKFIDDQGINVKDRDPEERLPENIEKVYVKIFDLELEQVISNIELINTKTNEQIETDADGIKKLAKFDIAKSQIKNINIKVEYNITIKNAGETAGYATEIIDYIPDGFTFDINDNPNWVQHDGYITTNVLADEIINPDETKEVKLILRWSKSSIGQKTNISEISKHADENKNSNVIDIDSIPNNKAEKEDDLDITDVIITVKTGSKDLSIILTALGFMAIVSLGIVGYKKIVV